MPNNVAQGPLVFLDIETIPDQSDGALDRAKARVKVPANYSKPETIEKFKEENGHKEWLRTSLDPSYGHVVAIGVTIRHGSGERHEPVKVFAPGKLVKGFDTFDFIAFEENLLRHFWEYLARNINTPPKFVNHYLTTFDMPFLIKRSIINRVRVPFDIPANPKLWANDMYDTRVEWTGDRHSHIKLDELARVLRVGDPEKYDGHEGSDVWDMVQAGEVQELGRYCRRDVELTRDIFDVMTGRWDG